MSVPEDVIYPADDKHPAQHKEGFGGDALMALVVLLLEFCFQLVIDPPMFLEKECQVASLLGRMIPFGTGIAPPVGNGGGRLDL
jgi:hypothetical protein